MNQQLAAVRQRAPATPAPSAVYLARLDEKTRRNVERTLSTTASIIAGEPLSAAQMPWGKLRYEHSQAIRAALCARYAPSTVNTYLTATDPPEVADFLACFERRCAAAGVPESLRAELERN